MVDAYALCYHKYTPSRRCTTSGVVPPAIRGSMSLAERPLPEGSLQQRFKVVDYRSWLTKSRRQMPCTLTKCAVTRIRLSGVSYYSLLTKPFYTERQTSHENGVFLY